MQVHGSCAARGEAGVLLLGPSGSGKSDLVLRLLDRGFDLVADDQVDIDEGWARPVPPLAGLLEVRGFGIVRLPFRSEIRLALAIRLDQPADRLPSPARDDALGLPMIAISSREPSAAQRVSLALDCVEGRVSQLAGALSA